MMSARHINVSDVNSDPCSLSFPFLMLGLPKNKRRERERDTWTYFEKINIHQPKIITVVNVTPYSEMPSKSV